jgi:Ran GTPase-activating protein (RanGAP) involved in mRNA processing and transport
MPFNLSELNIYHCRIGWKQTSDLLERIKTKNQLSKLSLVRANINEISIYHLEKILKSKSLVNLDISWNSLTPRAFKGFLETLSTNRRLQYINLAWNNLSDVQATPEDQKAMLHSLGQMIKHNKNLLHMDITSAGLGSFIVREIGTCLRRARSILCIHLSGNPGMNTENFEFLVRRIRCRPNEDIARFVKIENVISEMTKDFPAQYH